MVRIFKYTLENGKLLDRTFLSRKTVQIMQRDIIYYDALTRSSTFARRISVFVLL